MNNKPIQNNMISVDFYRYVQIIENSFLPDICEYGDSFEQAYQLALDSVDCTAELLQAQGKSMPAPENDYERITLNLSKTLRLMLVSNAKQEGTTVNQYISDALNFYAGYMQANNIEQNKQVRTK